MEQEVEEEEEEEGQEKVENEKEMMIMWVESTTQSQQNLADLKVYTDFVKIKNPMGKSRRLVEKRTHVYVTQARQKKNFRHQSTVVFGVDQQWQADLVDVQKFRQYYSGFWYLLCVIDVFFPIRLCGPHKKMVIKLWIP